MEITRHKLRCDDYRYARTSLVGYLRALLPPRASPNVKDIEDSWHALRSESPLFAEVIAVYVVIYIGYTLHRDGHDHGRRSVYTIRAAIEEAVHYCLAFLAITCQAKLNQRRIQLSPPVDEPIMPSEYVSRLLERHSVRSALQRGSQEIIENALISCDNAMRGKQYRAVADQYGTHLQLLFASKPPHWNAVPLTSRRGMLFWERMLYHQRDAILTILTQTAIRTHRGVKRGREPSIFEGQLGEPSLALELTAEDDTEDEEEAVLTSDDEEDTRAKTDLEDGKAGAPGK